MKIKLLFLSCLISLNCFSQISYGPEVTFNPQITTVPKVLNSGTNILLVTNADGSITINATNSGSSVSTNGLGPQTPWTNNVNGAGFSGTNINQLSSASITATNHNVAAAIGTDTDGTNIYISAGQSTGTGKGGNIVEFTSPSSSTGSTSNNRVIRRFVSAHQVSVQTNGSAQSVVTVNLPITSASSGFIGGRMSSTAYATDGTSSQVIYTEWKFGLLNKSGAAVSSLSAPSSSSAVDTGSITQTAAWATVGGNPSPFKFNITVTATGITPTTEIIMWTVEFNTIDTGITISPL